MDFRNLFLIALLTLCFTNFSYAESSENIFTGPPQPTSKFLKNADFAPMTAHRLSDADIGWINIELLQELGFDTKDVAKLKLMILHNYSFAVADEGISKENFTKESKTFYADRYGGSGTGGAFGSGRAAGAGIFQIKGIGRTPLVVEPFDYAEESGFWWTLKNPYKAVKRKLSDRHHSHGAATLREAFAEAVWGEILNKELPYGSNRVVAVITTKLKIGMEPRALVVRENSLRPAHFMKNDSSVGKNEEKELKRAENLGRRISEALPLPESDFDGRRNSFYLQILEFTNRVGRTFGAEFAHSLYHGSTSPSNIELTGRALDHGPMTALDGFSRLMFADEFGNGRTEDYSKYIVNELADALRESAPEHLRKHVPSRDELRVQIKKSYNDQVNREFLWRTGVPRELIDEMMTLKTSESYTRLLKTIALAGNSEKVNSRYKVPQNTGEYDVPTIINLLAEANYQDEFGLRTVLKKEIPDDILRTKFSKAYFEMVANLIDLGLKNDISPGAMAEYLREAASLRNKRLEGLHRGPNLWIKQYAKVLKFNGTDDPSVVSEYIDKTIEMNSRNYLGAPDFVLILSEPFKTSEGTLQIVFDARRGQRELLYSIKSEDKNMNVELVLDNRKIISNELAFEKDGRLFFRLPYIEDIAQVGKDVRVKAGRPSYKVGSPHCGQKLIYLTKISR